eukprot:gb/GEZN01007023.1/.p1 GENE.gb/GEZN01007023.1/~~gb/GEZN01007023.1/.p1  ORF type:complete len:423 (-),score=60.45 gb/GEZN01007023.1/:206-1474(-)
MSGNNRLMSADTKRYEKAWDFYHSIGSPKLVVAPMVNQSELAFRRLTRKYKAQLCYTPMLSSKLFAKDESYRKKMMVSEAADRPLFAQFCGHDPAILLAAAKLAEGKCDAVDLNLGCPQGIARKGRYGAFLLEEFDLVKEIVSTMSQGLKIPVTCKIRIFQDEEKTLQLCHMLQQAGCQLLTVHGRTKEQNKQTIGSCNFQVIRRIKKELKIPIFANGGVGCLADVGRIMAETGVDGVMTSEAILGNPALFTGRQVAPEELARHYLSLVDPNHSEDVAALRPHLFKILFREFSVHTNIRNAFADGNFFGKGETKRNPVEMSLAMLSALETEKKKVLARIADSPAETDPYLSNPTWYDRYNERDKLGKLLVNRASGHAKHQDLGDTEGQDDGNKEEEDEEMDAECMSNLFGDLDDNPVATQSS